MLGPPGVGESHVAKAIAQLAVQRGHTVLYREAHILIEEINQTRVSWAKSVNTGLVIDDLLLRKLPAGADDELAEVLMSRCEKLSMVITSNRPLEDWSKLLS